MHHSVRLLLSGAIFLLGFMACGAAIADEVLAGTAQLGPRPFYLVDEMDRSRLKRELSACAADTRVYEASDFSIGHRGAPMQFPEHTAESYIAAARMGAGILECDVSITADGELVCRHAQCDLHTTTNILETPLAEKCSGQPDFSSPTPYKNVRCCTTDITLEEFKSLTGKMDAANGNAATLDEYLNATADWRTDLYTTSNGATLLSHAESIELFKSLGRKFTPELKSVNPDEFPPGIDQSAYARKLIREYIDAGVPARDVWAQSFNYEDVLLWINEYPDFGEQAVFLDGRYDQDIPLRDFRERKDDGLEIIAPPMQILLTTRNGRIVPSKYARRAKRAGLDIISWTTERSGRVREEIIPANGAFYYDTTVDALANDGDILTQIDVLVQRVGIFGLFSDWPATTTFYANCKNVPALRAMQGDDDDEDDDDRDDD
ncbi:MAG: glycerophosphodiester phosphodiesterase family protein [Pseudomonadota bacterium]